MRRASGCERSEAVHLGIGKSKAQPCQGVALTPLQSSSEVASFLGERAITSRSASASWEVSADRWSLKSTVGVLTGVSCVRNGGVKCCEQYFAYCKKYCECFDKWCRCCDG